MSCIIDDCESMIGCSRELGPSCFKCKAGKWGIRCSEDCSTNCSDGCNINSGECLIKKEDNRPATDMRQMKEGTDIKSTYLYCLNANPDKQLILFCRSV